MTASRPATSTSAGVRRDRLITVYTLWDGKALPFPIVPCHADRDWIRAAGQWPYKCLPLRMAAETGWEIRSPVAFTASWDGSRAPAGVTLSREAGRHFGCVQSTFGLGVVTFNLPYLFRTSPGVDLWVRGPANFVRDGVQALEGIVETDWAEAKFTMNWKLTRPDHPVRFDIGDPICVVVPYPRAYVERFATATDTLSSNRGLLRAYERWRSSRRSHIEKKRAKLLSARAWQGKYHRGRREDGSTVAEHRRRVRTEPFPTPPVEDEPFHP